MKHKIGDIVKVNDLNWYNRNKNSVGHIRCGHQSFVEDMSEYCGQIATITEITAKEYYLNIDGGYWCWTDDMFEGLAEEPIYKAIVDKNSNMTGEFVRLKEVKQEINLPEGYIFKDENGNIINTTKIVLEKKKKEYPKTYEECCKVLGIPTNSMVVHYCRSEVDYEVALSGKLFALQQLLICRDAYWKIAGEEMGLGKLWEPDWNDGELKYCINVINNLIVRQIFCGDNHILAFPTEEMRDTFYDNFKELIEICKELL